MMPKPAGFLCSVSAKTTNPQCVRIARQYRIFPMWRVCLGSAIACFVLNSLAGSLHAQTLPGDSENPLRSLGTSVLPDVGTNLQPGSLIPQRERSDTGITITNPVTPGWTITPSLSARQAWTDHVQGANVGSTLVTTIQPGILATANTARLQSTATYEPDLEIFSADGGQNRIGHNFDADGLITLIPEKVFVDLRGFGNVQSALQGVAPTNTVVLAKQNEVQTQFYTVHPYLRQRFSDWFSMELGGSGFYTTQDNLADTSQTQTGTLTNQHATTGREYLSLSSGPQLGRLSLSGLALATQSIGTGVLDGAHRDQIDLESGYAISRTISVLAGGGWQSFHYAGFPSYNFSGPDWDLGVHWKPNADSSLTFRYGRRGGVTAPEFAGTYAFSPRTSISARYSEGITTDQEQLQNAISESVLDPLGNPIDPQTGSPLLLINNFYGVQTNVTLTKRGSITGTLLHHRDRFLLSFGFQSANQLAASTRATAGRLDTEAIYGSLNWQHEFSRNVTSIAFFQYGHTSQTVQTPSPLGNPSGITEVVSVSLIYSVVTNLDLFGQYAYTKQPASGTLATVPSNLVVFGVKKTF
jgi:uncharacterized protein (PEP-CTERM system associated)